MTRLHLGIAAAALTSLACTTVIGEDFQGYVAAPLYCDPAAPQAASPRQFVACGATQTCVVALADGSPDPANEQAFCFDPADDLPLGSSCTYANDCGVGAVCTQALGCADYCAVGASCAGGAACIAFSPDSVIEGTEIGVCVPPCDPSQANACPGTCSFISTGTSLSATNTGCILVTGARALGDSCTADGDCVRGLACDSVAQRCTRYCRAGSEDCGSKACVTADEPQLTYDGTAYGYCDL